MITMQKWQERGHMEPSQMDNENHQELNTPG